MARVTTYLARLDHRGSIALTGPDGPRFLQGQTTCDIEQLDESHSLTGAYCNPQGRMVCDFRLWQLAENSLLLGLERDTVESALATFGKYIVFSKAEMRDVSPEYRHYAAWGEAAAEQVAAPGDEANTCWRQGDVVWTVSDVPRCFEALVPEEGARDFERAWADADMTGPDEFRRLEILAGIGHVSGPTGGMFLPQMLNYQVTGRVNFRKGCYTGQEVVARMHYRGKVKRPMLIAHAPGGSQATPGDPIYRAGSDQPIGNVVSAAQGDRGLELLVCVATDALDNEITLGRAGPALEISDPPYSLG